MLTLQPADEAVLEELTNMYDRCKAHLLANGIFQWDDSYPNREFISFYLEEKDLYTLCDGEILLGAVVLNEWQSPQYKGIIWEHEDGPVLCIHMLALDPLHQGKGYGQAALLALEDWAREKGYKSIRLDAFSQNRAAVRLYEKNGYEDRGAVYFDSKPVPYNWYGCYEKQL
ncbi:GNAT family N-acetyltransferase [Ectobacillus ponti]|uniref:GNAT family N-acetyltransferase n=1 Tax=Ectobacillus ponti TaxID=2961894 RepID=A0AA41X887_9BACI|nr:GNAT family N-acetyltransferase [Ectobacillus ponti]MCP8970607.1 GNAT family N-acetyltransferase [Ectobacillus ponti]